MDNRQYHAGPAGNGGGATPVAGPDPIPNQPGVEFDGPRWPGLPANRQPRYRTLTEGEPIERLKLYAIGRDAGPGIYVASQVLADQWVFTPAAIELGAGEIKITPAQRASILAKVIG